MLNNFQDILFDTKSLLKIIVVKEFRISRISTSNGCYNLQFFTFIKCPLTNILHKIEDGFDFGSAPHKFQLREDRAY